MSADTHTHIHQLMSYELVYTSIHSSIMYYYDNRYRPILSVFHVVKVYGMRTIFKQDPPPPPPPPLRPHTTPPTSIQF